MYAVHILFTHVTLISQKQTYLHLQWCPVFCPILPLWSSILLRTDPAFLWEFNTEKTQWIYINGDWFLSHKCTGTETNVHLGLYIFHSWKNVLTHCALTIDARRHRNKYILYIPLEQALIECYTRMITCMSIKCFTKDN